MFIQLGFLPIEIPIISYVVDVLPLNSSVFILDILITSQLKSVSTKLGYTVPVATLIAPSSQRYDFISSSALFSNKGEIFLSPYLGIVYLSTSRKAVSILPPSIQEAITSISSANCFLSFRSSHSNSHSNGALKVISTVFQILSFASATPSIHQI